MVFVFPAVLLAQSPYEANIQADLPFLSGMYLYLHQHPELSFQEKETSRYLAEELRKAGFEVTEGVGGYGIVGVLSNGKGPVILVRTDMDGLPVTEDTGLPYASKATTTDASGKTVGIMHACGHDVHMTVWAGTARLLASIRNQWKGTLVFVGQPAEERGSGARAMLEAQLYERFPHPDYALALHTNASLPAGTIGLCPGPAMANVDMLDITVYGEGGHGALPHTTKDPIVLSAQLIMAFQTIVSREISPLEACVLTVGSIHGGSKGNIIPSEVKLELTLRSYNDDVQQAMIRAIRRVCQGQAAAAGLPPEKYPLVTVRNENVPFLYNDPALSDRLKPVFERTVGAANVQTVSPSMAGEDFSQYGRTASKTPLHLFWLGVVEPSRAAAAQRKEIELPSLHSAQYAPLPDPSIPTGVAAMSAAVLELMPR